MLSIIKSASLIGINAVEILVEVDVSKGMPGMGIVGLPDAVIKESKNRIKSAIKNSGFTYELRAYTINLAPVDLKKEGTYFELPMAVGILQATRQIKLDCSDTLFVGGITLNGNITPVKGILSICHMAVQNKFKKIVLSMENYEEALFFKELEIIPFNNLNDIRRYEEGTLEINGKIENQDNGLKVLDFFYDFAEVKGQFQAKRAVEIAAAGGHNVLFVGPPGSGKTMLLKRMASILPEMNIEEALVTNKIRSISGKDGVKKSFDFNRPFRNPHHTVSYAGMVGGGSNPTPGEISLAHNGVLFLDELPEFPRNVLEVLRQPIEEKKVIISRASMAIEYPANFMFLGAMNPCPCGYYRDEKIVCSCQRPQIKKYYKKISGPIIDRIDIIVNILRLNKEDFFSGSDKNPENIYTSAKMKERVLKVREIQKQRFGLETINATMQSKQIKKHCAIDNETQNFLGRAIDKGVLTGRSFDKVLKVARTTADLEASHDIKLKHICEAMQFRKVDLFDIKDS